MDLSKSIYIGLGSVWFSDFLLAHKELSITDMISIESDPIGIARAKFNCPFRSVTIEPGSTRDVLPELLSNSALNVRPWIIWLDFDGPLNESVLEDLQRLVEGAPPNSILLSTFNAMGNRNYGPPKDRPARLKTLLGAVVPDKLDRSRCEDDVLCETISTLTLEYMQGVAAAAARPGGFIRAFELPYRDGASMVTIGGVLPAKGATSTIKAVVGSMNWPGICEIPIVTPLLTLKEAATLQAQLPRTRDLSRRNIQRLGFDLDDKQIKAFQKYYKYYPSYAQISI